MQVRGVDFVGVAVSDMEKARQFYGELLGLAPVRAFGEDWAEYQAGNVTISLIKAKADEIAKRVALGPWTAIGIALAVPDVEAALAELRAKGVSVTQETSEFPPCYMATVQDPSGNFVWLHQRKDGTAG